MRACASCFRSSFLRGHGNDQDVATAHMKDFTKLGNRARSQCPFALGSFKSSFLFKNESDKIEAKTIVLCFSF